VRPRDWQIFQEYLSGKSGTEIAAKYGLTLPAVGMVKLKVQRKVSEEIAKLEGTGPNQEESRP
jgi:hypothetical protein